MSIVCKSMQEPNSALEGEVYDTEKEEAKKIATDDIMPYDEYIKKEEEEIEKGKNGVEFYEFEIQGRGEYEGKYISYFGVQHENKPEHGMFDEIEDKFDEVKPDIVFVEGYIALNKNNKEEVEGLRNISKEEAIIKHGENIFTAKLAADRGIPVESPEPEFSDEVRYLVDQGFSKDHVFAYYFHKVIPHYIDSHSNEERSAESFREFMEPILEGFKESTNWDGFDYSYEHAVDIGRAIWNEDLDVINFNERKVDPVLRKKFEGEHTTVNDIAAESSLFRDMHIANKIDEALQKHDRVLVVYGSAHAVMQEPALRKVVEGEE